MDIFLVIGSFLKLTFTASKSTIVDGPDFTIASPKNLSILNLEISNNQEVKFLPIRVGQIFPRLIKYEVKLCLIRKINRKHFADLLYLKYINLYTNKIEVIDESAFDQLTNLEEINLGLNAINSLSDGIFRKNINLKKIFLRENLISHISTNTFRHLSNLQEINLSHNKLTTLKPELFTNCKNLQKILLMSNQLSEISGDTFSAIKNLTILDLRWNKCYNKRFANSTISVSDSCNEI